MTERKENFFDTLDERIRSLENSVVNFLSVVAPWIAPFTPAYMTFDHTLNTLGFPIPFAWATAILVKILGFSAISTYMSFWYHNRRNTAESKRAPLFLVVVAFVFYLTLIVASNVLLDTFPGQRWTIVTVRALLTLQTIPAALLVAVRTQHRDLLSEIAREKRERAQKVSENKEKVSEQERKVSENLPKDWRKLRPLLSLEQVSEIAQLSAEGVKKVSQTYQVDERTVVNWRKYASQEIENQINQP